MNHSQQAVSKDIHLKDKETYEVQSQLVYREILSSASFNTFQNPEAPASPIIITKNDLIKRRVNQVIKQLEVNHQILLTAKSNGIPKLISIVEIVKTQTKAEQYNSMQRSKSYTNPNYNHNKSTLKQKSNIFEGLDADSEDEDRPLHTHKTFQLPILNILLVEPQAGQPQRQKDLPRWTYQD
ncbi:hypothetical protein HYPBUDRAFT_154327, partial [Hyphopichia burtonii NRRL Y-1933]